MSYHRIIDYAWIAVSILWVLAAFGTKRQVRREFGSSRLVQVVLLVIGIVIIFEPVPLPGFLSRRVLPATPLDWLIGMVITYIGILFALWARFFLGRNWSAAVTVKQDHQLIQTGPYAVVRHPIYSGFVFGLLGTAVAFGRLRDFLGLVLVTVGWRWKSLVEERLMTEQFGNEYTEYKRKVKALVPFIW